MWTWYGQGRPDFAEEPGPGQESVWDYPRPPRLETTSRLVRVQAGDLELAATRAAIRVLETASPPTWYLPPDDVNWSGLVAVDGSSFCEWKGRASYWALAADPSRRTVAWAYPQPTDAFSAIRNYVSFYPALVRCFVDTERVRPQPGGFYGGWVTDDIAGPVKGSPGTGHW